jgi:hypothetical protein
MTGLLASVVGVVAVLAWMPPLAVQADPLDDLTDPIEETVDNTVNTVDQTVNDAVATTEDTGEAVTDTAGGGGGGTSGVLDGAGDATGDGGSVGGAGSDVVGSGGASGGSGTSSLGTTAEQRGDRAARGQRELRGPRESGVRAAQLARVAAEATAGFPSGAAAYIPLLVRVTNDANDDGSYSDAEAAPLPAADVPFQIRLENAGYSELAILAFRDTSPTPMETADDAPCARLVHIRLAPGASTTCRFTADGFAPDEGQRVVALFEVDAAATNQPSIVGTVADTTLITVGSGNVLGEVIRRTLAETGAQIVLLSRIAAGLVAVGAALIAVSSRHGASADGPIPDPLRTNRAPRVRRGRSRPPRISSYPMIRGPDRRAGGRHRAPTRSLAAGRRTSARSRRGRSRYLLPAAVGQGVPRRVQPPM